MISSCPPPLCLTRVLVRETASHLGPILTAFDETIEGSLVRFARALQDTPTTSTPPAHAASASAPPTPAPLSVLLAAVTAECFLARSRQGLSPASLASLVEAADALAGSLPEGGEVAGAAEVTARAGLALAENLRACARLVVETELDKTVRHLVAFTESARLARADGAPGAPDWDTHHDVPTPYANLTRAAVKALDEALSHGTVAYETLSALRTMEDAPHALPETFAHALAWHPWYALDPQAGPRSTARTLGLGTEAPSTRLGQPSTAGRTLDTVRIGVQINGTTVGTVELPPDTDATTAIALASAEDAVVRRLEGRRITSAAYVAGRVINLRVP